MNLSQRDISLAVPSLMVVLLAAFGILSSPPRLDSLRPPAPAEQPGSQDERVPARLWQDPLQILWGLEEKEVITATKLRSDMKSKLKSAGKTLVLGVLIPGSRYSESYEKRRRTRYAVLTGLGAMKYYPVEGDRIGLLCTEMKKPSDFPSPHEKLLLETPFEWFRLKAPRGKDDDDEKQKYRHVLVLWLDEDQLRLGVEGDGQGVLHPAHDLYHKIIPEEFAHDPRLDLNVIGPSSSNELLAYFEAKPIEEPILQCGDKCPLRNSYLRSPWSTAIGSEEAENTEEAAENVPVLRFAPMIGTDSELCEDLVQEFRLRGFDPKKHSIALLSEWDTIYGRNFVRILAETEVERLEAEGEKTKVEVHHLTYMRGIDGQRPGKKRAPEKGGSTKAADPLDPSAHAAHVEWPEGESQYDYLRRISQILEDINEGPKPVRVIGVTGSDVHDKLLVLRAIRRSFPDVCFFTTDLDVRLLHPGEYPWTRNLLIASHYGLEPVEGRPGRKETLEERLTDAIRERYNEEGGQKLNVEFPRFRYSYQTAVMLSVVASLEETRPWDRGRLSRVRLYEVGRKGARLLNARQKSTTTETPLLTLLGTILAAIVLGVYAPHWQRLVKKLLLLLPAFVGIVLFSALGCAIYFDQGRNEGEHLFWFEGMSIWPSEILLLALAVLSCYFLVLIWKNFRESLDDLDKDFFPNTEGQPKSERHGIPAHHLWRRFKERFAAGPQAKRMLGYGTLLVLPLVLLATRHFHHRPARGHVAQTIDLVLLNSALVGLGLVVFLLLDITLYTLGLVGKIADRETHWRSHGNRENGEIFSDYLDVCFIGELTRFHSKHVYFPFVLLLILGVAHYPVFDKFVIGTIELATFLVLAVLAGLPLIAVRLCAESARRKARRRVRKKRLDLLGLPSREEQIRQLDQVLGEIEAIRTGAFSSLKRNPALRAALIPFGGIGGLVLLESYLG